MADTTADQALSRPLPLLHRLPTAAWIAAAAILVVAAVLRLAGARGELWLDEIWSLKLIHEAETHYGFLWGLTIDNNHYLNTLYLYLLGPDASALAMRGLSILLGVLTVAAAGWAMRRSGAPGIIAAMAMFALSYPMVNYGSEARGYSGMILMTVLAIVLVEAAFEDRRRAMSLALAAVAAAGFLFQPVMALGLAMLGFWAIWVSWRSTRSLRQTESTVLRIFLPAAVLLIAIIGLLVYAVVATGGYQFGGTTPFSFAGFVGGYGGIIGFLVGLPDVLPASLGILLAGAVLALGFLWRDRLTPRRLSLAVIGIIIAPAVVLGAQPLNVQYPRYYLATGIIFLLLLADLFAIAWRSGGGRRGVAAAVALLFLAGSATLLQKFYQHGRGDVVAALQVIAADPDPRVTSNNDNRDLSVLEYYIARLDLPVRFVVLKDYCKERPRWLLTSQDAEGPEVGEVAQPECHGLFRRQSHTPHWGLSGSAWTLYRAE